MKSKKSVGLIILLLIYIIAIAAGIGIFILFDYIPSNNAVNKLSCLTDSKASIMNV